MKKYASYFILSLCLIVAGIAIASWAANQAAIVRRTEMTLKQQSIIIADSDRNQNIDLLLRMTLDSIPSASRIRVGLVHQDGNPSTQALLFDFTNVAARAGHSPGAMSSNLPIAQWNDFLPRLLDHKCVYNTAERVTDVHVIDRINAMSIDAFMACPIFNANNQFLGGVFISWDEISDVPGTLVDVETKMIALAHFISDLP